MADSDDPTEAIRRKMLATNQPQRDLEKAQADDKQTWTNDEAHEQFTFIGFLAPFCFVIRKSTGLRGSLEFTHSPRVYFNWKED